MAKQVILQPGQSHSFQQMGDKFSIAARLEYPELGGSAAIMEVSVNGVPFKGDRPLSNKDMAYEFADGRVEPYYYDGYGWTVFYSPDFNANNINAESVYRVVSDPGQAYVYSWARPEGIIASYPVTVKHSGRVEQPLVVAYNDSTGTTTKLTDGSGSPTQVDVPKKTNLLVWALLLAGAYYLLAGSKEKGA